METDQILYPQLDPMEELEWVTASLAKEGGDAPTGTRPRTKIIPIAKTKAKATDSAALAGAEHAAAATRQIKGKGKGKDKGKGKRGRGFRGGKGGKGKGRGKNNWRQKPFFNTARRGGGASSGARVVATT